ncbi:MAG: ankyrin repeat domain-containing protein [Meiothermus sp.]|nr:ankyrin repeat domain-containing protein [Meiothermus sp.]
MTKEKLNLALHDKVNNGDLIAVQAVVQMGADVNHRDVVGDTPLIEAAWIGAPEIVGFLLAKGVGFFAVGSAGKTALLLVKAIVDSPDKHLGHYKVLEVLENYKKLA